MRHKIVPVFIPHASCPNMCIFCNQKEITATGGYDIDSIRETIAKGVATLGDDGSHKEIAFYGGSFTAIEPEEQERLLSIAKEYIDDGRIDSVRVSTRPDSIDFDTLIRLKDHGVKTIELGIQSMSDKVLRANGRGHSRDDNILASRMIKEYGLTLGHQIMPGLYRSTPETMQRTVKECIALKPDLLRVYPCLVVKGTRLKELYDVGGYVPLTIDEAVSICKDIYLKAKRAGVLIIRMGLHPERDFVRGSIVAGPFHPAFKHLVISALFSDLIDLLMEQALSKGDAPGDDIVIMVNRSDVSNATGIKRSNILRIKEKFSMGNVRVVASDDIKKGGVSLNSHNNSLTGNILTGL